MSVYYTSTMGTVLPGYARETYSVGSPHFVWEFAWDGSPSGGLSGVDSFSGTMLLDGVALTWGVNIPGKFNLAFYNDVHVLSVRFAANSLAAGLHTLSWGAGTAIIWANLPFEAHVAVSAGSCSFIAPQSVDSNGAWETWVDFGGYVPQPHSFPWWKYFRMCKVPYIAPPNWFILNEDGTCLLLEDSDKIEVE